MPTDTPRLLSVEDVIGTLRVSRSTLYALIRHGDLHPLKIGRRTFFNVEDVNRYIAELTKTAS
ncbi:MAG: helix-turn-helix domain-containing protein [Acidimicrobiaceae bacterium]|nr:helix-turn-helix domain-containing protein [Acidimicrobiaceae bacterium]